jgi:hypothetical protein|tara:strand:+ start:439 stop:564 length:126 start_codon:yes stop_codon:yes gene_type:complete
MNKIKNDNEKAAEGFWMVINIIILMCVMALFGGIATFLLGN